ncbi:MAG: sugar phosphate isomerase/epimerase [bacterium]|nr:sugar phosphate isomerase/epimerase [bacterium]
MKPQNHELKTRRIREAFGKLKAEHPQRLERRLNLSWSNWGFGMEPLERSVGRLADNGIRYIELHGNRYGADLGYQADEVQKILAGHGVTAAGICGMFSAECDLASNRPIVRQQAIDYIRRNVDLGHALGVKYFLIVPAAVGRPGVIDSAELEFARSVETLQLVAGVFEQAGIRGAIEPIRSAEVSIVHKFDDALRYIEAVGSPGVQHINGDVYHMLVEESHISETIWQAGARLTNLHLADTNRCALGAGSLDVDTLIMALYLIGYNNEWCYATPEPLGPGGDPYPAMYGLTDPKALDELVRQTATCWREREDAVREI